MIREHQNYDTEQIIYFLEFPIPIHQFTNTIGKRVKNTKIKCQIGLWRTSDGLQVAESKSTFSGKNG